jgi:diadenosine tetraphosphate (Ap4A) HIT family hydrolase
MIELFDYVFRQSRKCESNHQTQERNLMHIHIIPTRKCQIANPGNVRQVAPHQNLYETKTLFSNNAAFLQI